MNIYIADGNEVFRLGLRKHLEALYDFCHITDVDRKAVRPDGIKWEVMDLLILHKADKNDLLENFLKELKLSAPGARVLVLSDHIDFYEARYLFSLGVKGYADREGSLADLTQAIRKIVEGKVYMESSLWVQYLTYHASIQKEAKQQPVKVLTGKELEVAIYLSKGFKTNEISKLLNKRATTVSTQKSKIYKKLQVRSVVELLQFMSRY